MSDHVQYPAIEVQLTGHDGNAFAIMGNVAREIKAQGVESGTFSTRAEAVAAAEKYTSEAMESDSYDGLLQHAMRTVTVY